MEEREEGEETGKKGGRERRGVKRKRGEEKLERGEEKEREGAMESDVEEEKKSPEIIRKRKIKTEIK